MLKQRFSKKQAFFAFFLFFCLPFEKIFIIIKKGVGIVPLVSRAICLFFDSIAKELRL